MPLSNRRKAIIVGVLSALILTIVLASYYGSRSSSSTSSAIAEGPNLQTSAVAGSTGSTPVDGSNLGTDHNGDGGPWGATGMFRASAATCAFNQVPSCCTCRDAIRMVSKCCPEEDQIIDCGCDGNGQCKPITCS